MRKQAKTVVIRVFGGIGNQLFCYAAARRLALVNNAELVIDHISGFVRDYTYKRHYQLDHFNLPPWRKASATERMEPLSLVHRYLKRKINRLRPFERRTYIQQDNLNFDPRLLYVKPRDKVCLEGYWQSLNYFKDVEQTIRAEMQIKPPTDEINRKMNALIRDTLSVAVHVRFFDAPYQAGVNNIPSDYYKRAVDMMEELVPCGHYFLFSDHPDQARALVSLPDERITCVSCNRGDENSYADLWLMCNCKHFIIARSTFSWWGAWLSKNSTKHVIIPRYTPPGSPEWNKMGLIFPGSIEI